MKILVVSNLYPPETIGGYEIQCSQAVADLRRRGHDVRVLTTVPRRPVGSTEGHVLRLLRTPDVYSPERVAIRSPFWEFESNLLGADNVYILSEVLREWDPDVCYLWNLVAVGGVGMVAALEHLGIPWVWHLGDSVPSMLCHLDGELRGLGRLMGDGFTGRFLACSRTVVDTVEHLVQIAGRTRIVPNWVTGTAASVERDYYRGGALSLAFAGRLAEEKGVFILVDAAARLQRSGRIGFHLDIFGTGMTEQVGARIAELGLDELITLRGFRPQEEIRRHLARSDVFVFPTHPSDPMPLAPLEAASVGCVPLLPSVSGVSEWLVDGVHCLKAPRSAEGLAGALEKVMDGEVDLAAMSRRAVLAVHESFAIEAVMPTVEAELLLAAERRRPPTASPEDVYRMALVADALLRRHILERGAGTAAAPAP